MAGDDSAARTQGLWPTQLPHLRSHAPMVSAPDIHNLIDIHHTAAAAGIARREPLSPASHRPSSVSMLLLHRTAERSSPSNCWGTGSPASVCCFSTHRRIELKKKNINDCQGRLLSAWLTHSRSTTVAMLDKIDAPPPQMVVCDYCAKMVDKRELKHHQVAVASRGQGCETASGRQGKGGTLAPFKHTCTHTCTQQAFDCLQSELRIMQCPKGCGQNIEVNSMALAPRVRQRTADRLKC
jgi:hypothetical protein